MAINPYTLSNYGALSAVEQDDGSFTYPIYGVQANTYTGPNLQDVYGTDAMPMFQWVQRIQTGQGSFNPDDPADTEMLDRYEEFLENNPQAQNEMPSTAEIVRNVAMPLALSTGAALGTQLASSGDLDVLGAGVEGFKTMGGKGLSDSSTTSFLRPKGEMVETEMFRPVSSTQTVGDVNLTIPSEPTSGDLLRFGTESGRANWMSNAGAGAVSFGLNLLTGKDPVKAVKAAGATTILGVAGTALFGPVGGFFGRLLGNEFGGRVICNELMRQGIMTRKQVILDYKFTRDYLTPTHVNGYHVWAVWMVKQMRKGKFVKFWKHVAGHRANEIAYIYGERDKPDYLGKVYRRLLEPLCWSIGLFCNQSDWSVLYNKKEI
tara:strand:+ start:2359 stop:3486 length:1128 start_codon:yes stop_codon:yes gene_type:complete